MKRNLMWLLATITVVVLLFGYRTSRGQSELVPAASQLPVSTPSTAPTAPVTSTPASGSSGSSRAKGSGSSSSPSASPSSSPSTSASATYTGDVAETQWGEVQVAITVQDGKITAVDVPVYPNGNGRDYQINAYALPVLVQETISAQSAQIDAVSGATVTSDGYLQSLQSAIDKAAL